MGLLGKGFREYVNKQVDVRQLALGSNPTNRFLGKGDNRAFLTNTPWVRLASSVDLSKDSVVYEQLSKSISKSFLDKYVGDELAKNFILFGGVSGKDGGLDSAYSGINSPTNSTLSPFGGAYGFGEWNSIFSNNGQGYQPMPGITNVDFEYKNDGALSQASVNIKCFSKPQFQIIDVLFQRPGFTTLLEFGHSVFLDNNNEIQYAGKGDYNLNTKPFQILFPDLNSTTNTNHYTLAGEIDKCKKDWNGNYEGAFMKITKYNWKYNKDGSYDITVNLIGIGDIISSLKVNVTPSTLISSTNKTGLDKDDLKELKEEGNFIIGDALATELNYHLYKLYKRNNPNVTVGEAIRSSFTAFGAIKTYYQANVSEGVQYASEEISNFPIPEYDNSNKIDPNDNRVKGDGLIKGIKTIPSLKSDNNVFVIKNKDTDGAIKDYDSSIYITFGYLLNLITQTVNIFDTNSIPIISFDLNYDNGKLKNDYNYLSTYPGNMSSRPNDVLIPFKKFDKRAIDKMESTPKNQYLNLFKNIDSGGSKIINGLLEANSEFFVDGSDGSQGRLERVYLDINYIARTLNSKIKENKSGELKVSLIDFLKQILDDINISLGGLNEFRVIFNQEKQLISINSEVPSNCVEEPILAEIISGGVSGRGSFIKDIDLKSELTDEFATMISVGAQDQKYSANSQTDAGAFSKYSEGLTDRIFPIKTTPQNPPVDASGDELEDPFTAIFNEDYIDSIYEIYNDYNFLPEYIDIVDSYNTELTNLMMGLITQTKQVQSSESTSPKSTDKFLSQAFLPFNLGITIHGLGGVRIYDGFKVDSYALPPSYNPQYISLIIKSLKHTISPDGWTTKIETLPKQEK